MKHAYLIMAHNNFQILHKTLELLDSESNDFYIHIDKKVGAYLDKSFYKDVKASKIYFIERMDVRWGAYSQIACEIKLLESAVKGEYDYYHLISGVDLPIKTADYIYNFFEAHAGYNFIVFREKPYENEALLSRVQNYYLNPMSYVKKPSVHKLYDIAFSTLGRLGIFKRKLLYEPESFRFGANWFSITNELAMYVLENKEKIKRQYHHTLCGDELFLQTVVYNSPFKDKVFGGIDNYDYKYCLRLIDWTRGNPYVYKGEDVDGLLTAGETYLFARKFDYEKYPEAVDKVYNCLRRKNSSA